ncbi:bifunctional UDP-N-acetylglucosamine diphosphorylase/glucosamine-1-phosphate N-acetyltransferase GlmU, partial [candidate division WWE3 bacterium]|nr:bifunctional UDP-N-acetylglucosamine diphosphorylase/glucosamine-1-phosphate N-acetyltransferase GlmU [candidate division WWE3 bacterium]
YDGVNKHKTIIGDGSSTGSNSVLVAPVTLGKNVYVGAGSVVTKDVQDNALAITRAPQKVIPDWSKKQK